MDVPPEKIQANIRQASDEDLLDRCTHFRDSMEPEAIEWIEEELEERGIGEYERRVHFHQLADRTIPIPGGGVERCSFCRRPAVLEVRGWHRIFGLVPVFPRRYFYCPDHETQNG